MNSKKNLVVSIVLFFLGLPVCRSQSLKIGSVVPDFASLEVLNYQSPTLRLSEIKNKWILLDFWSTSCASCVKSFDKMDQLQERFSNDFQIIFINDETRDSTLNFFRNKKKIKMADVPYITADTFFHQTFPHSGTPFYVLLDSNRKIVAYPEHVFVREETIRALVVKGEVKLGQRPQKTVLNPDQTIFDLLDSTNKSNIESFFAITPRLKGFYSTRFVSENGSKYANRVTLSGFSVQRLFQIIFTRITNKFFPGGAVIIESDRKSEFLTLPDSLRTEEWDDRNLYTMDMRVPPRDAANTTIILKEYLESYFRVNVALERRRVSCLVLKRIKNGQDISTKGGKPRLEKDKKKEYVYHIVNTPFPRVFLWIATYFSSGIVDKPFIDATGLTGNVDMTVNANFFDKFQKFDLDGIRTVLSKYGLEIVEEEAETDVIVIRDKK